MEEDSNCDECGAQFRASRESYCNLAYCKNCRKKHSKDILELIIGDEIIIYTTSQVNEAEDSLSALEADFRLDLHKTLDTIPNDIQLPRSSCCVSYVGQLTATRIEARNDIKNRIKSGQIKFGALVFARGSKRDKNKIFTNVGSKAWFNKLVKSDRPVFVDDSDDHVSSVESIGVPSFQIFPDQDLLKILNNIMEENDNNSCDSSDDLFDR